jgi:hypothetical protein
VSTPPILSVLLLGGARRGKCRLRWSAIRCGERGPHETHRFVADWIELQISEAEIAAIVLWAARRRLHDREMEALVHAKRPPLLADFHARVFMAGHPYVGAP